MKNSKILVIVGAIVLIVLIAGSVFALSKKSTSTSSTSSDQQEVKSKKINADDIGLTFAPTSGNKEIIMTISKLDGVKSIDYEASYERDVDDKSVEGDSRVMDGLAPSHIEVKESDTKIERKITIGTCSKNVCRYHKGVHEVNFLLKVTFRTGDLGEIESKISL